MSAETGFAQRVWGPRKTIPAEAVSKKHYVHYIKIGLNFIHQILTKKGEFATNEEINLKIKGKLTTYHYNKLKRVLNRLINRKREARRFFLV